MSESIQVTSHISRDFLQNAAYFNTVPKVIWEYVSNSIDNAKSNQPVHVTVRITRERIMVSDNACGMSRDDLRRFFQMHGRNVRRAKGERVRGRYGTGKCAAFGIANMLRVETCKNGHYNVVELSRDDIEKSYSGEPFTVKDIMIDRAAAEGDGTQIIISDLNIRNTEVPQAIAYVERHLGRQLSHHTVVINDTICEYHEPHFTWKRTFHPNPGLAKVLGDIELAAKVSPIPLEKERSGIDVLSKGIWHDTTSGSLEGEIVRRIFGEVDMPFLEEKYDQEKIPPFDNTRNMTLNLSNPLVASLLGWIDECLLEISKDLAIQEKKRRESEESRRLARQAAEIEELLNNDFRTLQMELDKIRRQSRLVQQGILKDLVPGFGDIPTDYQRGGAEHGEGTQGEFAGPGEVERPGPALLHGKDKGGPADISEQKYKRSTFHVEYRHEDEESHRSHYERESRTIVINLDHPQIAVAARDSGIDSKQFRAITYEVAFVEYAIALGHEKLNHDEFYSGQDALWDIRNCINRVSRAL
jgi:hypothetical protein